jgi:hypothetical protein
VADILAQRRRILPGFEHPVNELPLEVVHQFEINQ